MFERYKQLAGKQQLWISLGGILLLWIIAYQLGIKKTVILYKDYNEQQQLASIVENAPMTIAKLRSQLQELDSSLLKQAYDRQLLFETVNTTCADLNLFIAGFGEETQESNGSLTIVTNQVEVRGSYHDILKLINKLEKELQLTRVASANFEKKNDRKQKRTFLNATLYLQNLLPQKQ